MSEKITKPSKADLDELIEVGNSEKEARYLDLFSRKPHLIDCIFPGKKSDYIAGYFPIHLATLSGFKQLIEYIGQHGHSINLKGKLEDHKKVTPLQIRVREMVLRGDIPEEDFLFETLLKAGANPKILNDDGLSLLYHMGYCDHEPPLFDRLIKLGAPVDCWSIERQKTGFAHAATMTELVPSRKDGSPSNRLLNMRSLIQAGVKLEDYATTNMKNGVWHLINLGDAQTLQMMLDRGVDLNWRAADGQNLLMGLRNPAGIRWLLERNPQLLDQQDGFGQTALMHAVLKGNEEAAMALIAAGANTKLHTHEGPVAGSIAMALSKSKKLTALSQQVKTLELAAQARLALREMDASAPRLQGASPH